MQQTNKYHFNLIDTSDAFSPEALNANTQKLEDALAARESTVDRALKEQQLAHAALAADMGFRRPQLPHCLGVL